MWEKRNCWCWILSHFTQHNRYLATSSLHDLQFPSLQVKYVILFCKISSKTKKVVHRLKSAKSVPEFPEFTHASKKPCNSEGWLIEVFYWGSKFSNWSARTHGMRQVKILIFFVCVDAPIWHEKCLTDKKYPDQSRKCVWFLEPSKHLGIAALFLSLFLHPKLRWSVFVSVGGGLLKCMS